MRPEPDNGEEFLGESLLQLPCARKHGALASRRQWHQRRASNDLLLTQQAGTCIIVAVGMGRNHLGHHHKEAYLDPYLLACVSNDATRHALERLNVSNSMVIRVFTTSNTSSSSSPNSIACHENHGRPQYRVATLGAAQLIRPRTRLKRHCHPTRHDPAPPLAGWCPARTMPSRSSDHIGQGLLHHILLNLVHTVLSTCQVPTGCPALFPNKKVSSATPCCPRLLAAWVAEVRHMKSR